MEFKIDDIVRIKKGADLGDSSVRPSKKNRDLEFWQDNQVELIVLEEVKERRGVRVCGTTESGYMDWWTVDPSALEHIIKDDHRLLDSI